MHKDLSLEMEISVILLITAKQKQEKFTHAAIFYFITQLVHNLFVFKKDASI